MKLIKSTAITAALAAASAVPAFAHTGPHDAPLLATVLHWLTSPTHAGLSLATIVAAVIIVRKLKRNS